jgi:hypothetical protein
MRSLGGLHRGHLMTNDKAGHRTFMQLYAATDRAGAQRASLSTSAQSKHAKRLPHLIESTSNGKHARGSWCRCYTMTELYGESCPASHRRRPTRPRQEPSPFLLLVRRLKQPGCCCIHHEFDAEIPRVADNPLLQTLPPPAVAL